MSAPVTYGKKYVMHACGIQPIFNAPAGRQRITFRHNAFATLHVKTKDSIRKFHIEERGKMWICGAEIGANYRPKPRAEINVDKSVFDLAMKHHRDCIEDFTKPKPIPATIKAACWIPIVGIAVEFVNAFVYHRNYLSDESNGYRLMGSILWQAFWVAALTAGL